WLPAFHLRATQSDTSQWPVVFPSCMLCRLRPPCANGLHVLAIMVIPITFEEFPDQDRFRRTLELLWLREKVLRVGFHHFEQPLKHPYHPHTPQCRGEMRGQAAS